MSKNQTMNRFLKYFLAASAILSSTILFAQKKWTLEECINYAIQNNIQLKRSDLQTKSVEKSYQQGYFNIAPSINGNFYHDYSNGTIFSQYQLKFVNVENQSGSVSINAEMELFKGLSNFNNLAKLRYELLSQKETNEIQKDNITLNIVAAYLQILYDNENLNYSKEQYDILQQQLQKAEKQSELGNISTGDMLNIKAQAINQKATLTSAKNKVQLSYLDLSQLLEIDSLNSFTVNILPIQVDDKNTIQSFSKVYTDILSNRPELRKAEYDVKIARKDLNMAYGSLSPRVVLGYTIGSGYDRSAWYQKVSGGDTVIVRYPDYTYKKQLQDYVSSRVYFSVQIPIFQRFTNVTRISKAKIGYLDAKYAQEETQKKVLKDIQQAYTDALASYDKFLAFQESVASYNEVFELAKQKFELGMINSIDYEVAHNNLIKAQGDLLHAKYSYILKLKILDFYRGNPITL